MMTLFALERHAPRECVMNNFEMNGLPDPAELIRQYGPMIWKIVSAYLKNPDDILEHATLVACGRGDRTPASLHERFFERLH